MSWPAPGQPVVSTTAVLTPYRPAVLDVTVPCPVLRAAATRGGPITVLATGGSTDTGAGVLVRAENGRVAVLVNALLVAEAPVADRTCGVGVHADRRGVSVSLNGTTHDVAGAPVPEVAAFRTDLDPASAAGLTARARTVNPFDIAPTAFKSALVMLQLLAAAAALWLLVSRYAARDRLSRPVCTRLRFVDGGVFAVLAGWAVMGPLCDDDGFVTMIARNSLTSGDIGNYYRWWNASESPFTLDQQIVAVLSQVSLQPLWLRVPSTVMGAVCWLVLSRALFDSGSRGTAGEAGGVEPAAVPGTGLGTWRVRVLLAVSFLVAWLPYNLGVRPEPYVALGSTVVFALLLRGRGPASLGLAVAVAALTVTASPSGLLVVAAVPVFVAKIVRMLRAGPVAEAGREETTPVGPGEAGRGESDRDEVGPGEVAGRLALLAAVGALGLTVVFADQSWASLATATRWHTEFSPSLPWYLEIQRYRYLLGEYQDGNALKRVPVLLCLALLPVVALLLAGRARNALERTAGQLGGCVAAGFALLWLTPSKWTLYFGSLAGLFAAFITVAAVLLARRARDGALSMRSALLAGAGVALAAGLAFSGTNDWWQPALYAVPWAKGPIRPAGLPLDLPPLWAGAALVVAAALWALKGRSHARRTLLLAPAALTAVTAATALAVLLVSFASAPVRRPAGSLALINLARLGGAGGCGLADRIEALPDIPNGVLAPAPGERFPTMSVAGPGAALPGPSAASRTAASQPAASQPAASQPAASQPAASEPAVPAADPAAAPVGFAAGSGWRTDRPPPDPPGVRASAQIWGSLLDGDPTHTGRLVTPWFTLPAVPSGQELAMTVSGRTDGGNSLVLDFGAQHGGPVRPLGQRTPTDLPHGETPNTGVPDHPDQASWRSVWLSPDRIPAGANRVRIAAADGSSDPGGWLAVTGPRLRAVVSLPDFLASNGPVLVNWPIAFLFPCVRDVVTVAHGIAGAPRAVLGPARRYDGLGGQSLDPLAAGDFAVLHSLGTLGEVPTRVVGHPDLDWGSLQLAGYRGAALDAYQVRLSQVRIPGWVGDQAQIVTESDQPGSPRGHS